MATKKAAPIDPLDQLAADPKRVLALILWQRRLANPDMFIQINPKDLEGFDACVNYLEVKPDVLIRRPAGVPAQDAIPAVGKRRAVPARAAIPPRPYVVVTLVEEGTENVIRPVENNEADFNRAGEEAKIRHARDQAPELAQQILKMGNGQEVSLAICRDAAECMMLLARVPQ